MFCHPAPRHHRPPEPHLLLKFQTTAIHIYAQPRNAEQRSQTLVLFTFFVILHPILWSFALFPVIPSITAQRSTNNNNISSSHHIVCKGSIVDNNNKEILMLLPILQLWLLVLLSVIKITVLKTLQ